MSKSDDRAGIVGGMYNRRPRRATVVFQVSPGFMSKVRILTASGGPFGIGAGGQTGLLILVTRAT